MKPRIVAKLRMGRWLLLAAAALPVGGCSVIAGVNPNSILVGTEAPGRSGSGYAAIVFLNRSTSLVQNIVVLTYPGEPPQVWVVPATPNSWDSILVECGFLDIRVIGATPVDLATGSELPRIDYTGPALAAGADVTCGSIVVVESDDPPAEAAEQMVTINVRVVPDSPPPSSAGLLGSALSPGADSGLILLRPEVEAGLAADLTASWQDETGRIFIGTWTLSGGGPAVASLLECPLERVSAGDLSVPAAPAATLSGGDTEVFPPGPLTFGADFQCGDAIRVHLAASADEPSGFAVTIERLEADSAVPEGGVDMFANLRQLLDEEGFAGRLSNVGGLLP